MPENKKEILSQLKMELVCEKDIGFNYNKASLLQGVIMQRINTNYAEYLHHQSYNPYSQSVLLENKRIIWKVCTLNRKAYDEIIDVLNDNDFTRFKLKYNNVYVDVINKECTQLAMDILLGKCSNTSTCNIFDIRFCTPTSFKKSGKYSFYPEIFNIYQSIINKLEAVLEDKAIVHKYSLDELAANTDVIAYNIKSTKFGLEGVKIPSFIGSITVKINGSQDMVNFIDMLFEFANYSGVGIKTSIGMGQVMTNQRIF